MLFDVTIQERGVSVQDSYRGISLEIVADKYDLHTGEQTTCHVTMYGFAGIVEPAYVALVNRTPAVISLAPGNHQMVTIPPDEVLASGSYKFSRKLVAVDPGQWTITATLMHVKFPEDDP